MQKTTMGGDLLFSSALKIAACIDDGKPFDEIADLVQEDAAFTCQCDALKDVTTVKGWSEWMVNFKGQICPDCKPTVHSTAWDAENKTLLYFATYTAKHSADGGPVSPPTNQETKTEYCYSIVMNDEGKCVQMTKVWNDGYALKELGWC